MSNEEFHKCPECKTENLEFRAWVDKYQNFSEWDEASREAWCPKCEEIVYPRTM